jgi:cell division initiation protein
MLTPQEITEKVFVKAVFGGYDMTGVDDFLEAVYADYTALYKENAILKGKRKVLVEKVEEYRSTEDAMRMALLTAQRMGEEVVSDANKKKDEIINNADAEVQSKLDSIANNIADEELKLNIAARETAKFIELSRTIMRKHSDFLTKLESARRVVRPVADDPIQETEAKPEKHSTRDDEIAETAEQIGNAVDRIVNPGTSGIARAEKTDKAAPVAYDDENEPTRSFSIGGGDDGVTPRPKFDFDDLKFGANFSAQD